MSVGWNDIFDENTDWTAVSFLQMFWNAYIERVRILTANFRRYDSRIVALEPGDPWYSYNYRNRICLFSAAPASPEDQRLAYGHPRQIVAGDYVARAIPYSQPFPYLTDGDFQFTDDPAEYSFCIQLLQGLASAQNSFADYGGGLVWVVDDDATTWPLAWTWDTLAARVGLDARGFTRKLPAEFHPASTRYNVYSGHGASVATINANTSNPLIANGDKARCLSTSGGLRAGEVYKRVAGAWVFVDPAAEPARPDTLVGYGFLEVGDYIGSWIWNEIRDCLNHLRWTTGWWASGVSEGMQHAQAYSQSPSVGERYSCDIASANEWRSTYADAKAEVDAAWPPALNVGWPPPFGTALGFYALGERTVDGDGVEVTGHAQAGRQSAVLRTTISTHAPSRVSLFIDVIEPQWGDGAFAGHFHDGGDAGIAPLGRHLVQAWDVAQGDPEVIEKTLGNTAGVIVWPVVPLPAAGDPTNSVGLGYELKSYKWLMQWDVTGGLKYTAGT